jgi:hypothetical protein
MIKIYEFSYNKINMIEVFSWLKIYSICNNNICYLIQFEKILNNSQIFLFI